MTISANPGSQNNIAHCFLATGVTLQGSQHLDRGEDVEVRFFTREEVYAMLRNGEIWQSLMAAPRWKYFALSTEAAATPRP